VTDGPSEPATTGGVAGPGTETQGSPEDQSDRDESALGLRERGRSFANIARVLGLDGAGQANAAFIRALRRRSAHEQETLRSHEMARLDALGERLRQRDDLDEVEIARRTRVLDRLRRSLSA
jgi:hypothetical protein